MPNNFNQNETKNFNAQMKRLEKKRLKLENRLNELYQQEKTIQSASAKQDCANNQIVRTEKG